MAGHTPLSEVLQSHLSSVPNLHQLARDADVPLATLHHWLNGRVRRPHTWQPLLRLAAALNLSAGETDLLLDAARHPPLSQLISRAQNDSDQALVARWTQPQRQPQTTPNHNLSPGQLTSCIGREGAIDAILELLGQVRLLTLTGPGGSGKTRLALEVAAKALPMFSDGVFFVDLVPISEPCLLLTVIAQTLNIKEQAGASIDVLVTTYLRECRMLLILDNFEHLLAAAPDVVMLLRAAPHLTILVTSRIILRVAPEHEWEVKPLPVPGPRLAFEQVCQSPAVVLFTERARAVRHEFIITPENAGVVAELCRRVDGLPLGIELAAARSRMFTPQAILEQFPHSLNLHRRGMGTVPERHRSLDRLLDWSHTLLDPVEQMLFRRLAVFAGGFTIPAVQAVCAGDGVDPHEVVELLSGLVDQSLVQVEQQPQAGFSDARYRLLETIRQYSQAKLRSSDEATTLHARHRDWCLALALQAEQELTGPDQHTWLRRLDQEYANLRAALEWNATPDGLPQLQLRLVAVLWRYWEARSLLSEGNWWHTSILERRSDPLLADAGDALWANVLCGAGALAYGLGDYARAQGYYDQSLAIYQALGDRRGAAAVLTYLGVMTHYQGNYGRATNLFEQSIALYQAIDDTAGLAWTFGTLGDIAHVQNDYPRARQLFKRSLALWRAVGNPRNVAWLTKNLGTVECDQGNYACARMLFEESLQVFLELGDRLGICYASINLGRLARYEGDPQQAAVVLEDCLKTLREIGDKSTMAIVLNHLGSVARDQGDDARASALFDEALSVSEQLGNKWTKAWALNDLGDIARDQGDLGRAVDLYRESLALRDALDDRVGIAYALESLAELCCIKPDRKKVQQAAQLWGAADAVRVACGFPLPAVEAERYQHVVDAARAQIDATAWELAWARGRQLPLEQLIAPWERDDARSSVCCAETSEIVP